LEDDVKIDDKKLIAEKRMIPKTKLNDKRSIETIKKNTIKKPKSFDELLQEAANMIKDDSTENKKLLKAYNESIKSLSKEDLSKMVDYVKTKYVPSTKSLDWAKKLLGENKTTKAKLLMYCNEIKK
jgi:hypothetical protein